MGQLPGGQPGFAPLARLTPHTEEAVTHRVLDSVLPHRGRWSHTGAPTTQPFRLRNPSLRPESHEVQQVLVEKEGGRVGIPCPGVLWTGRPFSVLPECSVPSLWLLALFQGMTRYGGGWNLGKAGEGQPA